MWRTWPTTRLVACSGRRGKVRYRARNRATEMHSLLPFLRHSAFLHLTFSERTPSRTAGGRRESSVWRMACATRLPASPC